MFLKVKEKKLETDSVFSLILEKPEGFNFYPGQYLDIELPIKDTRSFTISSSPTENFLMITTKTGISPFKKAMENLKKREVVTTSHPAGTFTLDESSPAVFIAGGIGITPFRSTIKYASDKKIATPIALIYSNSDDDFIFKEELTKCEEQAANLKVIYHNSVQHGRLNVTQIEPIVHMYGNTIYYLAGPPEMVDEIARMLSGLGVDEINIRYDRFEGY